MNPAGFWRQLRYALPIEFMPIVRELWLFIAFFLLFPLGFLFFLNTLTVPALRLQILVGAVMMQFALGNINVIAQSIGSEKQSKLYDLWVSLPISPVVFVLAISLSLLPFLMISSVVTLLVAQFGYHFAVLSHWPWLVGGLLLVWASTLGLGFLVGVYGGPPRSINQWAQFVGVVMTFFAPVFYPVSVLPRALQYVAYAWPVTWGSDLLHAIIVGDRALAMLSTAVLVGFSGAWVILIAAGLRWRQS
jgi:ABC-2 type transport system permease protein